MSAGGTVSPGYEVTEDQRKVRSDVLLGSKWVHRGNERHLVVPSSMHEYPEQDGWELGYGSGRHSQGHSQATKDKIGKKHKGKVVPKDVVERQRATLRNRKFHWYTDGVNNLHIPEGDVIPEGYKLGRIYSQEIKDKIKESCKNRPNSNITEETRNAWRVASKNFWDSLSPQEYETLMKKKSESAKKAYAKLPPDKKGLNKGKIWIHNDAVKKMIKPEDLPKWELQGYVKGIK